MFTKDSPSTNEEVLKKVKRSFQAGATAYMRKDEPRTWLECINETAIGVYSDKAIPEVVVKMLVDRLKAPLPYRLTDRELKALNLLAEDKRVNEIAEAMGIGFNGANFHLDNVKIKLEAKTLHGLVAKSLRAGLIW